MISIRQEVFTVATSLIQQFGNDSLIEAALIQDKMLDTGNLDGAKLWSDIGDAIEWILMPAELTAETQH